MQELIIQFEGPHPVELFGVNNRNIQAIKKFFPGIKIIARGQQLKVLGSEEDLLAFEGKWKELTDFHNRFNRLSVADVEAILGDGKTTEETTGDGNRVIVYGNNGKLIKARTPNQLKMVELSDKNDMVFAIGPAGTGKTYTAVALAVRAMKDKKVQRIVLTRPAVEAGENLGFLPGDLKEKLDPYLRPLYDALLDMLPHEKLAHYLQRGTIEIAPLAFMRGRTLANAFVILDEAQNASENQMKMFLTRMGMAARFIITGDTSQIDLPRSQPSGLLQALELLDGVEGIGFVHLDKRDVVRHKLVERIVDRYEIFDSQKKGIDRK